MLDFLKVASQIEAMASERAALGREVGEAIEEAVRRLKQVAQSWANVLPDTLWVERPDAIYLLPETPPRHVVLAVDGSQIEASRHEAAFCSLINIGSVFLVYGTGERPRIQSLPQLFYRPEDLFVDYGGKKAPLVDKLLAARRTVEESRELACLIQLCLDREMSAAAFVDGPLTLWMFEKEPEDFRAPILEAFLATLETARQARIPVVGYISDPGAREVVETLEAEASPGEGGLFDIIKANDAALFARLLKPGERSALFRGDAPILAYYGPHRIYCCYLNVGSEVVRLEMPRWVAQDRALLEQVHAIVWDQAQKGKGYPVALSEAHERAIVRGAERERFFEMVENAFLKKGLPVRWSAKATAKRRASV